MRKLSSRPSVRSEKAGEVNERPQSSGSRSSGLPRRPNGPEGARPGGKSGHQPEWITSFLFVFFLRLSRAHPFGVVSLIACVFFVGV